MDLGQWWAARRWVALLELIDQLPLASRLNEAIQNDPEQAELIARAREAAPQGEAQAWSPRFAEYDLHAHLLRDVIKALLGVQAAVVAQATGKAPTVPDYPRPLTEVDRAIGRAERRWAQNILANFGFDPSDF